MRLILTCVLCFLIAVLPGCQMMTPEQKESARISLDQARAVGNITEAQYDAAIEALDNPQGTDWSTLLAAGGSIVASILLGVPIAVGRVNRVRGPVATPQERAARRASGSA